MITLLRNLYNNGDNTGNIIIKTLGKEILCHDYIIKNTSNFLKEVLEEKFLIGARIIELDYEHDLVNIVLNYMYSEKIIDKELTGNEIIKLYSLISLLRCPDFIFI